MRKTGTMLDSMDLSIIKVLTDDGRASLTEVGNRLGVSRVAIRERIETMTQLGIIKGFSVIVDWDKAEGVEYETD